VYGTNTKTSTETEHAIVVESPARWKDPLTEYDRYGEPTGTEYVRYSACGVEVIASETEHATRYNGSDSIDG